MIPPHTVWAAGIGLLFFVVVALITDHPLARDCVFISEGWLGACLALYVGLIG